MGKEFMAFLKQYGVIGLAIAVIIGGKLNAVISSVVDGLLMPFIGLLIPGGDWRTLGFEIGGAKFLYGPFLGAVLDFLIVAFIVFWFSKRVLKEETVTKK